jgi:hypothetical protein
MLSILKTLADKQNKVLQDSFIVEPPHLLQVANDLHFFCRFEDRLRFQKQITYLEEIHSKMKLLDLLDLILIS